MPSIRRSLIAYFMILLVAAFGGVGFWVYRFTSDMVGARERAETLRIEQEYAVRCQETERSFNSELELQAATLGRELRWNYASLSYRGPGISRSELERIQRAEFEQYPSVAAAAFGTPYMALTSDIPGQRPSSWFQYRFQAWNLYWRNRNDEQVRRLFAIETDGHPKYFQFHFERPRRILRQLGTSYRMPSFPMDVYSRDPHFTARFDDVTVGSEPVRRVIYRASLLSSGRFRGSLPDPSLMMTLPALVGSVAPALPSALFDRSHDPLPYVWVQAARPRAELDQTLATHDQTRRKELAALARETQGAMKGLQTQLLVIGLVTLIALPVGGWILIGRGVAPLHKLSKAVSQVSEKDFRLPVRPHELSHELVPIHDRLTHTLDALRRAFEREKQATADISHELRTPIAALLTTLEVALRKQRSAEQYRGTIEECREISKQLSRLVERIMTLAWLDAGRDRIEKIDVDATELAGGCATVIRPLAEAHGLSFSTDFDPHVHAVTDPDKLREVLFNLLHNAIEYNRPGGTVSMAVSRSNGCVELTVSDTGIGMTPEVQARIFERFFRADPSRTATGVHAGLGLAIVKEYVDRLGATIAVETEPGSGTTFRVTLPAGVTGARTVRDEVGVG